MPKELSGRAFRYLHCPHRNMQSFTECCLDCGENIWITVAEIERQEQQKQEQPVDNPWGNDWNDGPW